MEGVVHFQTARKTADKAVLKMEPVSFPVRGWSEFSAVLRAARPEVSDLLGRLDRPVGDCPTHPSYLLNGAPLALVWTADECRRLFVALAAASRDATERAYDFWEFAALVCCGINEEGVCAY